MMENRTSIELELQSISEKAALLPRSNPFAVPENYFDSVATEVVLKISPSENCFSVPEGYFEKQPQVIINKIHAVNKSGNTSVITMFRWIAAAVVIGILGWGLNTVLLLYSSSDRLATEQNEAKRIIQENCFDKEMEMISEKEAEHYLIASGHDVRAALIASFTNNSDLPEMEDFLTDNLTLENYLESFGIPKSETNKN